MIHRVINTLIVIVVNRFGVSGLIVFVIRIVGGLCLEFEVVSSYCVGVGAACAVWVFLRGV